jgi:hypothetical protein
LGAQVVLLLESESSFLDKLKSSISFEVVIFSIACSILKWLFSLSHVVNAKLLLLPNHSAFRDFQKVKMD